MKLLLSILLLTFIAAASSCGKEDELPGSSDEVLPGTWRLESVQFYGYDNGFSYLGDTIFNDTILYNVGTIKIPVFSEDSLQPLYQEEREVNCLYNFLDGEMQVAIDYIFQSRDFWWVTIRYNGPEGPQQVDSRIEEFYYSAHIFNFQYAVIMEDKDHILLNSLHSKERHEISLIRN